MYMIALRMNSYHTLEIYIAFGLNWLIKRKKENSQLILKELRIS